MFVKRFTKTAVSMLAAALLGVLTVGGCSDDDNGGNGYENGDDPGDNGNDPTEIVGDIGSHGHLLVGDWSIGDWNNERGFFTFKANGDFCFSMFRKVDDFWIGGENCDGRSFSADEEFIYFSYAGYGDSRETYNISGNTLTMSECYDEEYCEEEDRVLTKGIGRPSGTVHGVDITLNRSDWHMGSAWLELYQMGTYLLVCGVDYFDDVFSGVSYGGCDHTDGRHQAWYTSGNTLYMLGLGEIPNSCMIDEWGYKEDCAYTVLETVEFSYTHNPNVSLRLRNTSRDIDDTWNYYAWDYDKRRDDNDNRQSLSRRILSKR